MIISEEDKWNWCFQVWLGHLYKKTGCVFGMKEPDRIFAAWLGYPPHFRQGYETSRLGNIPADAFSQKKEFIRTYRFEK